MPGFAACARLGWTHREFLVSTLGTLHRSGGLLQCWHQSYRISVRLEETNCGFDPSSAPSPTVWQLTIKTSSHVFGNEQGHYQRCTTISQSSPERLPTYAVAENLDSLNSEAT